MRIKAFQAWRPAPESAVKVATPPYDVVDTAEARKLSEGNPLSFFHVTRAEIDLPDGTDLHADAVYKKAGENFRGLCSSGALKKEEKPCLYLYRLIWQGNAQRGIVAVYHVEDYRQNVIKKHEKTRQAPEDDRTKHITATNAQTGPVFLTYRDREDIDGYVARIEQTPPLYDVAANDGVRHTIWRVESPAELVQAFAKVSSVYIADGHHRAAAASRVARERNGAGDSEWAQGVLFPASQLRILPYNRCVKDLHGLTPEQFLQNVSTIFHVTENVDPQPKKSGQISMYLGRRWYGLAWDPPAGADPVSRLDVSVLQERLLKPVLGIDDPRSSPRIEFVGGIRGTDELKKRVDSGRDAVAFSMYPTTVDQLMAISDAGQVMPPKSTWFEPKLRDGLLVHVLD